MAGTVLEQFLAVAEEFLGKLDGLLTGPHFEGRGLEVKHAAHALKGACLSTGAAKLATLAHNMQVMGAEENFQAAMQNLQESKQVFVTVKREYEYMCQRLAAGFTE
eukprot:TRINITY_DN15434_c0_g1_i1.p1 TRINITY_DN15434_c0_g1~~TRINITY_DN15434_c0_g1_i1.p1  ORF type:complete len:106 (+),score=22.21 TRINITY_DN15434_c0_g1_i1:110-427(+)